MPDAKGDLYAQIRREPETEPLRSSFGSCSARKSVRWPATLQGGTARAICELKVLRIERPWQFTFQRLGLRRSILKGNEIGIHLGLLKRFDASDWNTTRQHTNGLDSSFERTSPDRLGNRGGRLESEVPAGAESWSAKSRTRRPRPPTEKHAKSAMRGRDLSRGPDPFVSSASN